MKIRASYRKDKLSGKEIKVNCDSSLKVFWFCFYTPLQYFLIHYFYRRGFKDGIYGFVYIVLSSFNQLVGRLKYWQMIEGKTSEKS